MKRLKYGLLAAAMVASVAVVPAVASAEEVVDTTTTTAAKPKQLTGEWIKSDGGWRYKYSDGTDAAYEFVGGFWLNKAGWWRDKSQYGWFYDSLTGWHYGNKTWLAGAEYLNNDDDNKAKWWKIDGQWYYFNENGTMLSDAVIDNYVVGKDGAWVEDVKGQWRHGQSKGHEKDWWYAIVKKDGTLDGYLADGVHYINGEYYLFDEEGWLMLDTIATITDSAGTKHFVAIDKDGQFVDYTAIEFDSKEYDDADANYKINLKYDKAEDLQATIRNMKSFLLATVSQPNATKAYKMNFTNGVELRVGKLFSYTKATGGETTIKDDGTVDTSAKAGGWSLAPENVYVKLTDNQVDKLVDLVLDKKYTGTIAYDSTLQRVQQKYLGKADTVEDNYEWNGTTCTLVGGEDVWIPINNYMNIEGFGKELKELTIETDDLTVEDVLQALNISGTASYTAEVKVSINGKEITFKDISITGNRFSMTVDGKSYKGYFVYEKQATVDGKKVDRVNDQWFIIYGDVMNTLVKTLAEAGLLADVELNTVKAVKAGEVAKYDDAAYEINPYRHSYDPSEWEKPSTEKKDWE
jgi:hypothetical protein